MSKLCFIFFCFLAAVSLQAYESGKLSNGLEYHVLHNEVPKGKASFWLVLKMGRMNENEHEKGIVHLIEHLAWSGIENMNPTELQDMLQPLGIQEFADHRSSTTGVDSTIFHLDGAVEHPQAVNQALFLIKKVCDGMALLPNYVEDERQEVLEETSEEITHPLTEKLEKQLEVLLGRQVKLFSSQATENIQNATIEQLYNFYHMNYRPDRMAVIAVGDFDEKIVKGRIEELFGLLVNAPLDTKTEAFENAATSLPAQISILYHEDASFVLPKISVSYLLPRSLDKDVEQLLGPLIEHRLQTLIDQQIVLSASVCHTVLSETHQLLEIGAVLFDETLTSSVMKRFIAELSRIEQVGFIKEEWLDIQYREELKPKSHEVYAKAYADQFLRHLLSIPLQIIPDGQQLEESVSRCRSVLVESPRVITIAIRSREALLQE